MNTGANQRVFLAAVILTGIAGGLLYAGQLIDMDLWWHLATGRHIYESRALLESDPFNFTSPPELGLRFVLLNGYWLGQVLFYLTWEAGGYHGLILFRVLLMLAMLCLTGIACRRLYQAGRMQTLLVLALTALILKNFTGMRPQLYSFLMAAILAYLLDLMTQRNRQARSIRGFYIILPIVMLLWANLHRGFMAGSAILLVYLAAWAWETFIRKNASASVWGYPAVIVLALFATLINPSGLMPYLEIAQFEDSVLQSNISEYKSPFTLLNKGIRLYEYWAFLALAVYTLTARFRRMSLRAIMILASMWAVSMLSYRYIPFFLLVSAPLSARA